MLRGPLDKKSKLVDAVILARGGSKGIPRKNLLPFLGEPLLQWTIRCCQQTPLIRNIYVSSDDAEILQVAETCGCRIIQRPEELASDTASSESGWRHAIDIIEDSDTLPDAILAPQVTSPLRLAAHLTSAIECFFGDELNSLFSASSAGDLCLWQMKKGGAIQAVNFDPDNRERRQDRGLQVIENGSFYIFTPETIQQHKNRFGDKLGYYLMPSWSQFEIDDPEDWDMCEIMATKYILETSE